MNESVPQWMALFNLLPDAILLVSGSGRIEFANPGVSDVLGYAPDEIVGKRLGVLIPDRFRSAHRQHYESFHARGESRSMGERPLLRALNRSGEEIAISVSIANLDLEGKRYSIAVMRDAGNLETEITEANFLAETDTLTGIGSRLRLTRAIKSAIGRRNPFGLLFFDLAKFKPFNDNYGHEVGDKVLKKFAERLQSGIRLGDTAARFGGDEFVIVLEGVADAKLLEKRAALISDKLNRRFRVGEIVCRVGFNTGGALYPRDGDNEEDLLRVADRNMYQAKRSGKHFHIE